MLDDSRTVGCGPHHLRDLDIMEAGFLSLPFLITRPGVNPANVGNNHAVIQLSGGSEPSTASLLIDGVLAAQCTSALCLQQLCNRNASKLLPCLCGIRDYIRLTPQSATIVSSTVISSKLHARQQELEVAQQQRFRKSSNLANLKAQVNLLQAMQTQGVMMVSFRVLLQPHFFYNGITNQPRPGQDTARTAHENSFASGRHVVQLLHMLTEQQAQAPSIIDLSEEKHTEGQSQDQHQSHDQDISSDIDGSNVHGTHSTPTRNHEQDITAASTSGTDEWVPMDRSTAGGHVVHDEVFEIVRPRGWTAELPDPPGLKCRLFRYQRRALAWMVWRETHGLPLSALPDETTAGDGVGLASSLEGAQQNGKEEHEDAADTQQQQPLNRTESPVPKPAAKRRKTMNGKVDVPDTPDKTPELGQGPPSVDKRASRQELMAYRQLMCGVEAPAGWPIDARHRILWAPLTLQSGQTVWVNHEDGMASASLPANTLTPLRGGMLCDEMGLGKTVEVIALMLANTHQPFTASNNMILSQVGNAPGEQQPQKQQQQGNQHANGSSSGVKSVKSDLAMSLGDDSDLDSVEVSGNQSFLRGPTLIVTPPTILQQWVGEISRHSNLKVYVYDGLKPFMQERDKEQQRNVALAEKHAKALEKKANNVDKDIWALLASKPPGASLNIQAAELLAKKGRSKKSGKRSTPGPSMPVQDDANRQDMDDDADDNAAAIAKWERDYAKLIVAKENAEAALEQATAEAAAAAANVINMTHAEAAAALAHKFLEYDVVLTAYGTLQAEVALVAGKESRTLRHAKRFPVPDSPLIQVHWHRLVLDEAQMVGTGLTAIADMANRLNAMHRWCVTGTPMGAGGLQDIFGSICALQYTPLDEPGRFKRLVVQPYLSGSQEGYQRLQLLIKPIMWRNSKAKASEDLSLPPRTLRYALLLFDSGERAFYEHIAEQAREANAAWKAHGTEDASQLTKAKQNAHAGQGDMLARKAAAQLTQLRLACVHPQLTDYWRQLSAELQLGQGGGGAMSVTEIMAKMRDQAQLHLQNEERDFCSAADILAAKLLQQAERMEPAADGKPRPAKRRKKTHNNSTGPPSAGGPSAETNNGDDVNEAQPTQDEDVEGVSPANQAKALREEALKLLEASYRVGEKGIDAFASERQGQNDEQDGNVDPQRPDSNSSTHADQDLDDITAGAASWRAWRLVQIRTCELLSGLYMHLGRQAEAVALQEEIKEKEAELRERVDIAVTKAKSHLKSLQEKAAEIEHSQLPTAWQEALQLGFEAACLPQALRPDTWAVAARRKWEDARTVEAHKHTETLLNDGEQRTVLLGTEVSSMVGVEEAAIQAVLKPIEGVAGVTHVSAALERLKVAQLALDQPMRNNPGAGAGAALWVASLGLELCAPWVVLHSDKKDQITHLITSLVRGWLVPGGDAVGLAKLKRNVAYLSNKLKERLTGFKTADSDGRAAAALAGVPSEALVKALESMRLQVELLRLWREIHVVDLKLEVENNNKELIRQEVEEAAAGDVMARQAAKYARMGVGQLRETCESLKKQCEELRSKKAYLENQVLGDGNNKASGKRNRSSSEAPRQPAQQMEQQPQSLDAGTAAGQQAGQANLGNSQIEDMDIDVQLTASPAAFDKDPSISRGSTPALSQLGSRHPQPAVPGYCHTGISTVLHKWWQHSAASSVARLAADKSNLSSRLTHAGDGSASTSSGVQHPNQTTVAHQPHGVPNNSIQRPINTQVECVDLTLDDPVPRTLSGGHQQHAKAVGTSQQQQAEVQEGNAECAVCFSVLNEGAPLLVFPCGHYFCKACSDQILDTVAKPRCPTCRRDVVRTQVFRVVTGGNQGGRHSPEDNPPEGKRVMNVKVIGSWMCKLEAVLRRLLLLRQQAPDEKALIFSHFPLALDLLSKALQINGIQHVSVGLKGKSNSRDAVAKFNASPEVMVFLLSLYHGAAGLTLVRANHVFMLDISTDPAVEQQAIARVHRIGQARPVTITRLLCKDTVEMQILEALQYKQQLFIDRHHQHVEGEENGLEEPLIQDTEGQQQQQSHAGVTATASSPGSHAGISRPRNLTSPGATAIHRSSSLPTSPSNRRGSGNINSNGNGVAMAHQHQHGPVNLQAHSGLALPIDDQDAAMTGTAALYHKREELGLDEAAHLLNLI